jgi:hypothetical protein
MLAPDRTHFFAVDFDNCWFRQACVVHLRIRQFRLRLGQRRREAMDSPDRCMTALHVEEVETDGPGFRALGSDAMGDFVH